VLSLKKKDSHLSSSLSQNFRVIAPPFKFDGSRQSFRGPEEFRSVGNVAVSSSLKEL